MKKVGIVMGSDSDLPILRKTMDTLASLEIPFECHVYSAHRTPEEARDFALNARKNGLAKFDYIVSNPPFNMDFSDNQPELASQKHQERFFAGVPSIPPKK